MARIHLLEQRPPPVFQMEGGHAMAFCNGTDHNDRCYKYRDPGHRVQDCSVSPKRPICTDLGRPANHIAGSRRACLSVCKRRGGSGPFRTNSNPSVNRQISATAIKETPTRSEGIKILKDRTFLPGYESLSQRIRPGVGARPKQAQEEKGTEDLSLIPTMSSKAVRVLQANLNYARQAQDLFVYILKEHNCAMT